MIALMKGGVALCCAFKLVNNLFYERCRRYTTLRISSLKKRTLQVLERVVDNITFCSTTMLPAIYVSFFH